MAKDTEKLIRQLSLISYLMAQGRPTSALESMQGYESELYSLPPENYYLPEIRFSDDELGALQTALHLLDGEFAYAEPLRLALQQVYWGRPSPMTSTEGSSVEVRMTA